MNRLERPTAARAALRNIRRDRVLTTPLFGTLISACLLCPSVASPADLAGTAQPALSTAKTLPVDFDVFEKSILELEQAQASGRVTSRQLVEMYTARIKAYDQAGPKLTAIVTLNPKALDEADALDRERSLHRVRGPLHGVPILVKDNYDTVDMPTSVGTLALATMRSPTDAFQVKRLREAGAVILGKTAMHELAAGVTTVSSLTGATRNPYDPRRNPGGSSGGTAAAVAANFAAAGTGSDTCGSIRIPAALQNLVGLRETSGLSSRAGIAPLSSSQDVAGPLARSVTDLAILLDATVGPDRADPTTAGASVHVPASYRTSLQPDGLRGKRIGVLKALFTDEPEDEAYNEVMKSALEKMKERGAELVDVDIPGLRGALDDTSVILYEFKYDLARFLAQHPGAPVGSLTEIIDRGMEHYQLEDRLRRRNAPLARDDEAYRAVMDKRSALRANVLQLMQDQKLDALAYPPVSRRPAFIDDDAGDEGGADTCQLSASTGLPAIVFPAGFTRDGLPVGLELMAAAFAEPSLLKIAYSWEQVANPRRPPPMTPALIRGLAPPPIEFDAAVRAPVETGPSAIVRFNFDLPTSTLAYVASASTTGDDPVVALTLQRGDADRPGPVVAHLLTAGMSSASSSLTLRSRDREDLLAGRLYMNLYTRSSPLGVGRIVLDANAPKDRH